MYFAIDEEKDWLKIAKYESKIHKHLKSLEEDRITYSNKVMKMYNDYEEIVFNLSEQSHNETIESIKNMSLGQRLKYQELITKRNQSIKNERV